MNRKLRVGVLVDLVRGPKAGGHVKCWEKFAAAAASMPEELDLTVHFSGSTESHERIADNVLYRYHSPVFSSQKFSFMLPKISDHSDLASFNPTLAEFLPSYDVVHTTDGNFCFTRTAQRLAKKRKLRMVNSIHTAAADLARLVTELTVRNIFGNNGVSTILLDKVAIDEKVAARMQARLRRHQSHCSCVFVSRPREEEDAKRVLAPERVLYLGRGVDRSLFSPNQRDRDWLMANFAIPLDRHLILYVGRMDATKNIMTLAQAIAGLIAKGHDLHLFCAGEGPERGNIQSLLGERACCPGQIDSPTLARLYASSDILAAPSEIEVFGNVVLEGLASGLPVAVAEKSGMSRVFTLEKAGVVVNGGGSDAWIASLGPLFSEPNRLAAMKHFVCENEIPRLPRWIDVLRHELFPVWKSVAAEAGHK
jgi:glycosyltransferase involved in cell wall biosynthesis